MTEQELNESVEQNETVEQKDEVKAPGLSYIEKPQIGAKSALEAHRR